MNDSHRSPQTPNQGKWKSWLFWSLVAVSCLAAIWLVSIEAALWRGSACIEAREHQRALGWLTFAERISWERAELHFLLARCYRRLEDFDRTTTHLERAHQLGWDVRELEREQWLALAQTNRFDDVNPHWADLFDNPGSDGPEISKAYVTGALALFRIGDALRVLTAWETDFPHDAEPHVLRGKLAATMLAWAESSQHYSRALELEPRRPDARLGLARALMRIGQAEQAESHLENLVQGTDDNPEAELLYAQSLVKQGKADEAEQALKDLLGRDPGQIEALLELGNLFLAAGRSDEALEYLQEAVDRKPENREIVYAYGKALQAQGQSEEATACFKFVDEATKPLIELKGLMNRLLANPADLELRFQVAYITWKYRSREEGEKWFRSLLKLAPDHEPTHAALAIHYRLSGAQDQAEFHQRQAGSIDVDQFFQRESTGEPQEATPPSGETSAGGDSDAEEA
jgi:tetratricopeptide (TPR) repeat protein